MSVTITVTENKIPFMTEEISKEINLSAEEVVRSNSVGLMYDLIGSTMPFPKGSKSGGGTLAAYNRAMVSYQHTINKAFKPIQNIQFGTLVMNKDYSSIVKYGFVFDNYVLERAMNESNFDVIYNAFEKSGWESDSKYMVKDDATMEGLMEFRIKHSGSFSKLGQYDTTYIRNKETIQKLRNAANQKKVGWMAGGWLKCALAISGKPDEFTKERKPIWMYNSGAGGILKSSDGLTISCTNQYGNFGGLFSSSEITEVISKRQKIIDKCMKKEIDNILSKHKP